MVDRAVPSPSLGSRIAFGAFGLVLLGAAALAGFFALTPWGLDSSARDVTGLIIVALFTPMALVLASAAWSMLVFAFVGRRGPLIHRGATAVCGAVIVLLMAVVAVLALVDGEIGEAIDLVGLGVWFAALISRFWRSRERRDARARRALEA